MVQLNSFLEVRVFSLNYLDMSLEKVIFKCIFPQQLDMNNWSIANIFACVGIKIDVLFLPPRLIFFGNELIFYATLNFSKCEGKKDFSLDGLSDYCNSFSLAFFNSHNNWFKNRVSLSWKIINWEIIELSWRLDHFM